MAREILWNCRSSATLMAAMLIKLRSLLLCKFTAGAMQWIANRFSPNLIWALTTTSRKLTWIVNSAGLLSLLDVLHRYLWTYLNTRGYVCTCVFMVRLPQTGTHGFVMSGTYLARWRAKQSPHLRDKLHCSTIYCSLDTKQNALAGGGCTWRRRRTSALLQYDSGAIYMCNSWAVPRCSRRR